MILIELNGKINHIEKRLLDEANFEKHINHFLGYTSRMALKDLMHTGEGIRREEALALLDEILVLTDRFEFQSDVCQTAFHVLINELILYNNVSHASPYQYERYISAIIDHLLFVDKAIWAQLRDKKFKLNNLQKPIEYYETEQDLRKSLEIEIRHLINTGCPVMVDFCNGNGMDRLIITLKKSSIGAPIFDKDGNSCLVMQLKSVLGDDFISHFQNYFCEMIEEETA